MTPADHDVVTGSVAPLATFGGADIPAAGGKGANLGELVRAGFRVPEGFVVSTGAYRAPAEESGPDRRIAMPEELRAEITAAYHRLGGGAVAVRSSATAEDLPGATFAGQQDTYLDVTGDDAVADAVQRCWSSLWTERAISYRSAKGIDSADVSIAVVVQRMVDAEYAGVMFTANPVTGTRTETVVDASVGLGEAVVSGTVTPDHYVLDPAGRVTLRQAGTPEANLTDGTLAELAALGSRIEVHFGHPQDIEWAYLDGELWVLQARPMTALPPAPMTLTRVQRRLASVVSDYFTVRPYPIDMTTWMPYGPIGMVTRMAASAGVDVRPMDGLPEEDGVVTRFVPPRPRPTPALLAAPFRLVRRARRYDPARWTQDPRFAAFRRGCAELAAREPAELSWTELAKLPHEALTLVGAVTDLRVDYLPKALFSLARLQVVLGLLGRSGLGQDLLTGARTRTADANRALADLAELVRWDPPLAEEFRRSVPAELFAKVGEHRTFGPALRGFIAEYGHRETASPVLMTPPTWGESPETVLGLVRCLAAARPSPTPELSSAAARKLLAHPWLGPRSRDRVLRVVNDARVGVAFREDSHFYFTQPLPMLRRAVLEMGARLAGAGVLADPEEVFHLRLDELEQIRDVAAIPAAQADQLRAVVASRAAKRRELAGVRLIDLSSVFDTRATGDALVAGTPASSGRAGGPVRVIHDHTEFGNLRPGDVLVCPYTNPAWTPLFQRAAAVVVDSGGPASHAAIVAREYGIPAIMGTGTATGVLTDGQLVTVDGGTGRVTAKTGS